MGKRSRTTKTGRGKYLVFVSHATADKWIARVFCEKIEATGARTFRDDRDIEGGDKIPDAIRKKIIEADELLVLLPKAERPDYRSALPCRI